MTGATSTKLCIVVTADADAEIGAPSEHQSTQQAVWAQHVDGHGRIPRGGKEHVRNFPHRKI